MKENVVTVQDIVNSFGLIWLNGNRESMQKEIKDISFNRPGLELSGFFEFPRSRRIILLGNRESEYIKTLSDEQIEKSFDFLFVEECPCCIICSNNEVHPKVLEMARKKDFPLFETSKKTNEIGVNLVSYLQEALAPRMSIHGTLIEVFSTGVLLTGESGIGKSETALELIKKGHHLISDDRVDITFIRNKLKGASPELLLNMIEVRGIGIIDVSKMFGINAITESKSIDLVIKLVKLDSDEELERLGTTQKTTEILGKKVPLIVIPVSGARSIGDMIEVAVTNFKLKKNGYDSTYIFEERFNELLRKGD